MACPIPGTSEPSVFLPRALLLPARLWFLMAPGPSDPRLWGRPAGPGLSTGVPHHSAGKSICHVHLPCLLCARHQSWRVPGREGKVAALALEVISERGVIFRTGCQDPVLEDTPATQTSGGARRRSVLPLGCTHLCAPPFQQHHTTASLPHFTDGETKARGRDGCSCPQLPGHRLLLRRLLPWLDGRWGGGHPRRVSKASGKSLRARGVVSPPGRGHALGHLPHSLPGGP